MFSFFFSILQSFVLSSCVQTGVSLQHRAIHLSPLVNMKLAHQVVQCFDHCIFSREMKIGEELVFLQMLFLVMVLSVLCKTDP